MKMGNDVTIEEIAKKLDTIINLIAVQIAGEMTVVEGAPFLNNLGLDNNQIAYVLKCSTKTVANRLAEAKKFNV